ncbi:universal stress protein UspA [Rubrobacter xylanophilus]|uniref:Universal stress protein UspA n=1 Tax=Rubrobacter xylanophilus TaxID=49319 RepID=A0A510HJ64_9ACTN|nr:universal stress protein [Rubrobacter xylanophilus]BBL80031.1 universal stress protein UspA [Rubrobacter xylanophilus]
MSGYPNRILLATDGTEDSARAARLAAALAAKCAAELHVAHVWRPGASETVTAAATRPPLPGEPPGYAERQARKVLGAEVRRVEEEGARVAQTHLRPGRPAQTLVALAARIGADLLVVGGGRPRAMRRAAAPRRPLLGKVADEVVRSAGCPVLVAHREALEGAGSGREA